MISGRNKVVAPGRTEMPMRVRPIVATASSRPADLGSSTVERARSGVLCTLICWLFGLADVS